MRLWLERLGFETLISQGDAFWIVELGDRAKNHLCIILSDPEENPDKIVLVTLTTWESNKDDSCILDKGAHPFIQHLTCVMYDGIPKSLSLGELEKLISDQKLKRRKPVSDDVLRRMLDGAKDTKRLPMGHALILDEQGFLE